MINQFREEQLNEIFNILSDGVLVTDPEGNIVFCNEKAAQNYQLPRAKLLGSPISFLLEGGFVDQSFWKLAVSAKKPVTYEQVCKSGKRLINKTQPVLDKRKAIRYVVEQSYSVEELAFQSNLPLERAPVLNQTAELQQKAEETLIAEFKSPAMSQVYNLADNMAPKNINILILGASGTGKSQLAKRIHQNSVRKNGPFITINCSTIPENLLESELFGYMKGAFSGASDRGKQGLVELADGGTLFLDEIGEIPLSLQVKFLQLVQEKTYLPVGGTHPKQVDTRIIAATNKDLLMQVKEGEFREDLYYRLAVVTINIPPLCGRKEDIRKLILHFTHVFNHKHHTDVAFSQNAVEVLLEYSWPGNIRELEHLVEYLILNAEDGYITPSMLPANMQQTGEKRREARPGRETERDGGASEEQTEEAFSEFPSLEEFLDHVQARLIRGLYPKYKSSYKLAERLQISQTKASRLIRKYIR